MISPAQSPKQQHITPQQIPKVPQIPQFLNIREGNSHIFAKTGHWSNNQKIRYLIFLQYHQTKLSIKQKRRSWKIFKLMSQFIQTRKPNQCRNHHEKMQSYFQSISNIIEYYKEKIPQYREYYERYQQQLKNIGVGSPFEIPLFKQEESISNNDLKKQEDQIESKRVLSRRTSMEKAIYPIINQITDKDLPKTDHTLRDFPQEIEEKIDKIKPKPIINYSFIQNKIAPQQFYAHSYFNNFSMLQIDQNLYTSALPQNFFSICLSRSESNDEYKQWMECQHLYLSWKNMYERLAQSNE